MLPRREQRRAKARGAPVSVGRLRPVPHRSLTDGVAEKLRRLIVNGGLAPGEKIDEKLLCQRLGVSRTPFREAMRLLAAEGLVRLTPRRGARVAEITLADLAETFPILGTLEALAAEFACGRITDAEIRQLRRMQERMVESHEAGDLDEYFRLNESVHRMIRDIGGNAQLIEMLESFSARVRRARCMANLCFDRWTEAIEEHEKILAALEERDGARVSALMKAHLANKHAALAAALTQAGEGARPAAE